ncbi:hypothetical protein GCM10011608_09280 [Micromonospora sonchi]|uniref:Uncharacterized protein n=1 Tax=Micromonospora sonchi TaxID=1763543 RepID=A0A917TKJ1_9ACTN|nr:hypothetical protein [Micromonospora sonchi]GGM26608.1 hypothetical protein GCM10011608_09280 [Micromonospora sonchi]
MTITADTAAASAGFDLVQARRDTPNWPPLDGDRWADRHGDQWIAYIAEHGDTATLAFLNVGRDARCLARYALEKHGPLTLVAAGAERQRFERLPADARERYTAYLAAACWLCGPEGSTGVYCGTCDESEVQP